MSEHLTWVEHLDEVECWRLAGSTAVGRIGVLVDSAPEIYPVNYAIDEGTVVFRTDDGSKLRGLGRSPSVCFETDDLDTEQATGWSVLIKGRAMELTTAELDVVESLPLTLWAIGEKTHWIRIIPTEITGRRVDR